MPPESYQRRLSIFRAHLATLDWETYRTNREAYLESLPPAPHFPPYPLPTREQRERLDNWLIGYTPIAHPLLIPLLTRDLTFIIDSFLGHDHYPFRPRYEFGLHPLGTPYDNWNIGKTAHPLLLELLTEAPTSIIGLFLGYDSLYPSYWSSSPYP
jgi:hypothetical protein